MNEKELLNTLSSLKRIEPRKDWVIFVKNQILGSAKEQMVGQVWQVGHVIDTFTFLFKKPAFAVAGFGLVISLGLLFQFNQQRLAQDTLVHLALAQERLEQLEKLAGTNRTENFSTALKEFQETSAKLSKEVPQFASKNRAKALQAGIAVIQLQKSIEDLQNVFGVSVGEKTQEELQSTVGTLIENELTDLATRTLSAEQQALFEEAKAAFETRDYETAVEKIWSISN